jgi:hypothetical protein
LSLTAAVVIAVVPVGRLNLLTGVAVRAIGEHSRPRYVVGDQARHDEAKSSGLPP